MRLISSWLLELIIKKNSYLNNYSEKLFCQANCFNFQSSQGSFFVKHNVLIFSLILSEELFCESIKILSDFWLGILNLKNASNLKKIQVKNLKNIRKN